MGCKWKPGECQGKSKGGEKTECENCSGSSWTLGDSERAETTAKSQRWGKPQARFEHGQLHSKQISSTDNCRVKCLPCATRLKLPTGAFSKKNANKMSMRSYSMPSRERKRIESDLGPLLNQEDEQSTLKKVIRAECWTRYEKKGWEERCRYKTSAKFVPR